MARIYKTVRGPGEKRFREVGLSTRTAKGSVVRYGIDYTPPGRPRVKKVVGTRREAQQVLARIQVDIQEGKYGIRSRTALTFQQLAELWFEHAHDKKSLVADRCRMPVILDHFGTGTNISTIEPRHVVEFRKWLTTQPTRRGTPMKPATVNRYIALLRAMFNVAIRNRYLAENPAAQLPPLREDNERDRICSTQEIELILAHAKGDTWLAVLLGHETGMRLSEIITLTWRQIDLEHRIVSLIKTKNGRGRRVPLSSKAMEALRIWHRQEGNLFAIQANTVSPTFKRLTRALEIEDLRFHDLRHTRATHLRRAGVDLVIIKRIMGWRSWKMLERYQTVSIDELRGAAEKVEKSFATFGESGAVQDEDNE